MPEKINGRIWRSWAESSTSSTTGDCFSVSCTANSYDANVAIWRNWVSQSTNATTTDLSHSVWQTWVAIHNAAVAANNAAVFVRPQVETPEQIRARVAAAEQRAVARRAEDLARTKAQEKAHKLLIEHLTPRQEETLRMHGYFDVEIGDRVYRIRKGGHGGWVERMQGQKATDGYCIYVTGECPPEDHMLAQKLMLEANEQEFLRIANRTAPRH